MINTPQRINPLDRQPRKAIGIELYFSDKGTFVSNFQTRDSIKNNIINFLLTDKGERFFNIDFGAGLPSLLFDNISEARLVGIKEVLLSELEIYFPNITIKELTFTTEPDTNSINVKLKFSINDTPFNDEEINVEVLT